MPRVAIGVLLAWIAAQVLWVALWSLVLPARPPLSSFAGLGYGLLLLGPPALVPAWSVRLIVQTRRAELQLERRAVTTRSGYRLVPATGDSIDSAIVCLERDPSRVAAAELEYLREHYGDPDFRDSFELVAQALFETERGVFDRLTVDTPALRGHVYFDVSRTASAH